ncbi:MAG: hypothetical protein V7K53_03120 [Nostoc sp.]|uniref:hypothetical protein n=1 Tax=Nostoc sp. TaxID=1180 RepID=UPI002FF6F99F
MLKDSGELPVFYLGSYLIKSLDLYISSLCDGVPARRRRSLLGKIPLYFGILLHHGKYE